METRRPQVTAMDPAALSGVALKAAADGNLRLLKKAAKQVDLRIVTDADGWNALHVASDKGRLDICRFLIEDKEGPGLDVNSRSAARGETPVFVAASEGHLPVLRYLLARGGDPAMPDVCGGTPLHGAALNGQCDVVKLLLSKGAPVDPIALANKCTPLHFALAKDHHQVLGILLDHGADPNKMMNRSFSPPLVVACGSRCLECIKILVQAGADVNLTSPYGQTALNEMVGACLLDIDKLKEAGADPNYPDKALDDNLANIIKFLLEAGANANIPNELGKIPMMLAAAWGSRKLVEILFPWTKPIPSLPDWNVDAIIRTMKLKAKDADIELEECLPSLKSKAKEAFTKGDYLAAVYFYSKAIGLYQLDAALFSNRSVCYLRMGEGQEALADAVRCRMMRPRWAKAWYRQGAALSLLKNYREAVHAFEEALKLDSASDEVKKALREAIQAMGSSGQNA